MTSPTQHDFQAFTVKTTGRASQIITPIGISEAYSPATPPPVIPPISQSQALWDTGASRSVISSVLASQMGLQPVGATQVSHAGGNSTSPTYIVNLMLPNNVGFVGVIVTEFPTISAAFSVIVGMDVITHGDLVISNVGGNTTMSFRTPSKEVIDYVVEANRIRFAGVGRNAPCPCGSKKENGEIKKFKHCHGATL